MNYEAEQDYIRLQLRRSPSRLGRGDPCGRPGVGRLGFLHPRADKSAMGTVNQPYALAIASLGT